MRSANRQTLVELAQKADGPIGKLIKPYCRFDEVNQLFRIDVEACEAALLKAGYEMTVEDGTNAGKFVRFYLNKELKAFGFSGLGKDDALAHACFGAVREENAAKEVDVRLSKANVKVDAGLRLKLEQRFITAGAAQLDKDMELFKK